MKQTGTRAPKTTQATLPQHEKDARRARAKALALPAIPRKRGRPADPAARAVSRHHPALLTE